MSIKRWRQHWRWRPQRPRQQHQLLHHRPLHQLEKGPPQMQRASTRQNGCVGDQKTMPVPILVRFPVLTTMVMLLAAAGTTQAHAEGVLVLVQVPFSISTPILVPVPVLVAVRGPHEVALTQAMPARVDDGTTVNLSRCPQALAQRCVWMATASWCCSPARVYPHHGSMSCPWVSRDSCWSTKWRSSG